MSGNTLRRCLAAAAAALLLAGPSRALPLGASLPCGRGGLKDAAGRIDAIKAVGFESVTFVPNFAYPHLDTVDESTAPEWGEVGAAAAYALRQGLAVAVKPHLEPAMYSPGFDSFKSENHSWRARAGWRGFFDVDPMAPDYRRKVVLQGLAALAEALAGVPEGHPPVRFELGSELMNSTVERPERWVALLSAARVELGILGLEGRVLLSHNFSHHVEIPEDFVLRMGAAKRSALARYIKGLDAVALSQYMDLTAAMPAAERGARLPAPAEVAGALALHERNFRREVLAGLLGLKPSETPPLHIGEFGVGRGGLRHPNLWEGEASPEEARALEREIAIGHRGLIEHLKAGGGRSVKSATLWLTGRWYDVFGWLNPADAVPEAAAAIREGLAPAPPADFDAFWAGVRRDLAQVPVDLKLDPAPAESDRETLCYKARYAGLDRKLTYAWYCRPAAEGRYPAILVSPWYGLDRIPAPRDIAKKGFAVLWYQGRGFEVDQASYPAENADYVLIGIESKETYVFRDMFSRALRGVDVLAGRPEVDPKRIGAAGASQGGGLSLFAAALHPAVAAASADFPFLCDIPSSMKVSEGVLGEVRRLVEEHPERRGEVLSVLSHFDIRHFAPRIRVPVRVQVGLKDRICPPAGVKAVFGAIPSADKTLEEYPEAGHGDENAARWQKMLDFLFAKLKGPASEREP